MPKNGEQHSKWAKLNRRIEACRECERLVEYCQRVAREKRAAYRECEYWGRPVGNFGDPAARLLVVGLAPGAHGANRTGRVFTGDSSGDWLYRALHKAGFANQPHARERDDGLRLTDCAITGVLHCAPPDNLPSRDERENCRLWLARTIDLVPVKVLVALGGIAWQETVREIRQREWHVGRVPKFGHGATLRLTGDGPALAEPVAPRATVDLRGGRWLFGCYHPSRQNTNTGRLTEPMLDAVFARARRFLSSS